MEFVDQQDDELGEGERVEAEVADDAGVWARIPREVISTQAWRAGVAPRTRQRVASSLLVSNRWR